MAVLSVDEIKALWIQAGGNPQNAAIAAAVALAESAGKTDAAPVNGNGSVDRGLWQINSVHGAQSTLDPLGNARAAVAISDNGANWKPWCTAYTDGACGSKGGAYNLTSGSSVAKFLGKAGATGTVSAGGVAAQGAAAGGALGAADAAAIDATINGFEANILMFFNVILNNAFYAFVAVGGVAALIIGLIMMSKDSVVGAAVGALKRAI